MQRNDKLLQPDSRQRDRWFYFSLALLALAAFLLLGSREPVLFDDSGAYMRVRRVEGVMPIYPLFLLLNQYVFGLESYLYAVVIEQAVLAAGCVVLFVRVVRDGFGLKYWESYLLLFLTLLPFTVDMPQSMVSQQILTEGIAYALFYLFMILLLKAVWTKRYTWIAGAFGMAAVLSMVRSQLQILFGVCGIIFLYVVCKRRACEKKLHFLARVAGGLLGCLCICLVGILIIAEITAGYRELVKSDGSLRIFAMKVQSPEAYEAKKEAGEDAQGEKAEELVNKGFTTSQYVSLIFSRGMYEADPEDVELFEDEVVRGLYTALYQAADAEEERYTYARTGLWMWQDIVGGIGKVGKTCFMTPSEYYVENCPEIIASDHFSDTRNAHLQHIGITLIKAHFGRFLYHTLMMLPQAFICTVFFQIRPIYLLCHLMTLFLYLSAMALMIWGYVDWKADHRCAEFMALVLGSNVVMVIVISLVFFGQQRYLVYNFGVFYVAYYLLLRELWNIHIRDRIMVYIAGRRGDRKAQVKEER
ncbi:MAG: hypothetical protein K2M70_06415 [Lachnospiraceae bacterium]|nr:hypothetical protein [Lachnospiraceae bacterium]